MKNIFIVFMFSWIGLFAQPTQSQIVSSIKSNPALLDTPQAKEELSKRGLSKNDVLSKIKAENNSQKNNLQANDIKNDIDLTDDSKLDDNVSKEISFENDLEKKVRINPLEYTPNEELLSLAQSQQSIIKEKKLNRFGASFFKNRNNINQTSIPTPSNYIISIGDTISIWIYGTKNETMSLNVDKNGNINIPKIGPLKVSNKTFGEIENFLKQKLEKTYTNNQVTIDIDKYSTIQVNLVGDVEAPGVYNLPSLSSVKTLLINAGGIKPTGSLRDIFVKRDGKVIAKIDFYKLFNSGSDSIDFILNSNDTVFIPKASKIVSIQGAVNTEAKFELKKNENLKDLIGFAKGIKSNASKYGFLIKRNLNNKKSQTLQVDLSDISAFKLLDGDKVFVRTIDKIHDRSVYLLGNVVRPGERELLTSKSLKELLQNEIKSLTLKGVFLQDTLFDYALIKRKSKDLTLKVDRVNLNDIIFKNEDYKLQENDQIFIINKFNSNIHPFVTINGDPVINEGKYNFYKGLKVIDLIKLAGADPYSKIKLTTYDTPDLMPHTKFVDENYVLSKFDTIELFDYYMTNEIKNFQIIGEVNLPDRYTLNKEITLQKAIELAGGFTQKASRSKVEIIRYSIVNDERVRSVLSVNKKDYKDFQLHQNDIIKVFKIANWNETKYITLKGEVKYPGVYPIETGEKLSSVLKRAGGFTDEAFIEGSVFTRETLKQNEQKRMKDSISKVKQQLTYISLNATEAGQEKTSSAELLATVDMLDKQLQDYEPLGRLVVYLQKDLNKFTDSEFDIRIEDKDTVYIPSINDTVSVYGEVMNPGSFVYDSSKDAPDYIKLAGGLSYKADSDHIYLVKANGEAKKVNDGYLFGVGSNYDVSKGSTLIVPMKIETTSSLLLWKDISQIVYQLAVTAASLDTLGAL